MKAPMMKAPTIKAPTIKAILRGLAIMLALAVPLAIPARAERPEVPALTLVHIPVANFLTAYVAKDQGYFMAHGLDVTLQVINQGNTAVAGIMSGSAQIATPTPTTFLQAVDSGLDLVVLASTHTYPTPNKVGLLVANASNIDKPQDLLGKRIGVNGLGGMQHVLLQRWLQDHGVAADKVTFVEIGYSLMGDAIRSGQVDGVTISEPFYQRVLATTPSHAFVDLQTEIPAGTVATMYVATREWATAHPNTVAAFRGALQDSVKFIQAQPQAARTSLLHHTGLSEALVKLTDIPAVSVDVKPQQLQFWIDLAEQQKLITSKPDAAHLIAP